jgi:hypothetical protein
MASALPSVAVETNRNAEIVELMVDVNREGSRLRRRRVDAGAQPHDLAATNPSLLELGFQQVLVQLPRFVLEQFADILIGCQHLSDCFSELFAFRLVQLGHIVGRVNGYGYSHGVRLSEVNTDGQASYLPGSIPLVPNTDC